MQVKRGWSRRAPGRGWLHVFLCGCPAVCLCLSASFHTLQYLLCLSLSLIYSVSLLSVWVCTQSFICLLRSLPASFLYLSRCLPVFLCASLDSSGRDCSGGREGRGGGGRVGGRWLVKGSQGTHRSACLWSLHYRIWHSARAHLISLRTHTHTPT